MNSNVGAHWHVFQKLNNAMAQMTVLMERMNKETVVSDDCYKINLIGRKAVVTCSTLIWVSFIQVVSYS